jgi:hypothetical protein
MVSFFPNWTIANLDTRKKNITVRHLAGMVNGFESGCLAGDEATLNAMRAAPDWVQAALDRKVVRDPGSNFCYDSPGMHLLSAILQESTGMTELDFARQYLFGPLGIREAFWQSDPQGTTHGWGDLYLKPRDAAKIGYLWLNKGVWDGQQIVSADWVADSVTVHSSGGIDDYGYGWWISKDSYYALGRGGQNVKVYPAYNAIVVTTASNFDFDQINPLLVSAFIDPKKPLPANPAGVAKLKTTLTALTRSPQPWPISPLPDTAEAISGKTYVLASNALDVATLRFDFSDKSQAIMYMKLQGRDAVWPIGLDGEYRVEPAGKALRGYWADTKTFVFEVFEDGLTSYQLHFEDDRLLFDAPDIKIEGQQEIP